MRRLALSLTVLTASAVAGAFMVSSAATSDPVCGDRDEIVKTLQSHFNEQPQAIGVVDQNAVIEVFVSDRGTWTILATGTDGNSCLVSSGESWESRNLVVGVDA